MGKHGINRFSLAWILARVNEVILYTHVCMCGLEPFKLVAYVHLFQCINLLTVMTVVFIVFTNLCYVDGFLCYQPLDLPVPYSQLCVIKYVVHVHLSTYVSEITWYNFWWYIHVVDILNL